MACHTWGTELGAPTHAPGRSSTSNTTIELGLAIRQHGPSRSTHRYNNPDPAKTIRSCCHLAPLRLRTRPPSLLPSLNCYFGTSGYTTTAEISSIPTKVEIPYNRKVLSRTRVTPRCIFRRALQPVISLI